MKEHGILFTGEMVRAILDGRKTLTSRLFRTQPTQLSDLDSLRRQKRGDLFVAPDKFPTTREVKWVFCYAEDVGTTHCMGAKEFAQHHSPYGQPGDVLIGRETWAHVPLRSGQMGVVYRADGEDPDEQIEEGWNFMGKWKSGMIMPWAFSRLRLRVEKVWPSRLQDMTEEMAVHEGIEIVRPEFKSNAVFAYAALWHRINPKHLWVSNPWVWRIQFRKV